MESYEEIMKEERRKEIELMIEMGIIDEKHYPVMKTPVLVTRKGGLYAFTRKPLRATAEELQSGRKMAYKLYHSGTRSYNGIINPNLHMEETGRYWYKVEECNNCTDKPAGEEGYCADCMK